MSSSPEEAEASSEKVSVLVASWSETGATVMVWGCLVVVVERREDQREVVEPETAATCQVYSVAWVSSATLMDVPLTGSEL